MILRLHEWLVGPIPGLPLRWDCAAPMTPRIAVGLPSGLTIGRGVSPPEKQRRAAPAPVIEANSQAIQLEHAIQFGMPCPPLIGLGNADL